MKSLIAIAACAWIALTASAFAQAAPPPASAYGRLPYVQDAALTPDGKHLAVLRAVNDQLAVEVVDASTFAHVGAVLAPAKTTFRNIFFANDERLIVVATTTQNPWNMYVGDAVGLAEYARAYSFPLDGSSVAMMMNDAAAKAENSSLASMWPSPPNMPGKVLMPVYEAPSTGSDTRMAYVLKSVDLVTGRSQTVMKGGPDTDGFILNQKGEVAGRVDTNEITNSWTLYARNGGGWRSLGTHKTEFGGDPMLRSTLPDGRFVKFADLDDKADFSSVIAIDPVTGAETTLFTPTKYNLGDVITDRWTGEIVGYTTIEDFPMQTFLDPQIEAVRVKLVAKFNGGYAAITDWDKARDVYVVHGEKGPVAPAYYLYRPGDDSLKLISSQYPEVPPQAVGDRAALKYKARDGVSIPAYLTTPSGLAIKNLPLVVLVHGGPAARDEYAYDWWASFLASRGYAVLQPQYRGSEGFGKAWEKAGQGQWGARMQNDVSDGVAAMVKIGIADPKRVCIVGASYGGYAALAGATLTPDLYTCAVSVAGVSDLLTMLDRETARAGRDSSTYDYWRTSIGSDRAALKTVSPIEHVDAVKAPVLLMHGQEDTVVPYEQSSRMVQKLKSAGKDVRFVELSGEDHWLSSGTTRTKMLQEIDKFLAETMKPK